MKIIVFSLIASAVLVCAVWLLVFQQENGEGEVAVPEVQGSSSTAQDPHESSTDEIETTPYDPSSKETSGRAEDTEETSARGGELERDSEERTFAELDLPPEIERPLEAHQEWAPDIKPLRDIHGQEPFDPSSSAHQMLPGSLVLAMVYTEQWPQAIDFKSKQLLEKAGLSTNIDKLEPSVKRYLDFVQKTWKLGALNERKKSWIVQRRRGNKRLSHYPPLSDDEDRRMEKVFKQGMKWPIGAAVLVYRVEQMFLEKFRQGTQGQ